MRQNPILNQQIQTENQKPTERNNNTTTEANVVQKETNDQSDTQVNTNIKNNESTNIT